MRKLQVRSEDLTGWENTREHGEDWEAKAGQVWREIIIQDLLQE